MSAKLKPKIETLLNSIRADLFYLQERLEPSEENEYFTPAHDAFKIIEKETRETINFIDSFTPPKERAKKYKRVILELINLDKRKLLTDQIGNYED